MPKRYSATVFQFKNGLTIKGSYKLHIGGVYLDLVATNIVGDVLVSRTIKLKGRTIEASDALVKSLTAMVATIKGFRIDSIDNNTVLAEVVRGAFEHTFRNAV